MRRPTNSNRIARNGRMSSPLTLDSTRAPMRPPTAPGIASRNTSLRSMLFSRQCDTPAARPLATFARLTVADTAAGLIPALSRMLDDVGPKPMPSAPSTMDAKKPANAISASSVTRRSPARGLAATWTVKSIRTRCARAAERVCRSVSLDLLRGCRGIREGLVNASILRCRPAAATCLCACCCVCMGPTASR